MFPNQWMSSSVVQSNCLLLLLALVILLSFLFSNAEGLSLLFFPSRSESSIGSVNISAIDLFERLDI